MSDMLKRLMEMKKGEGPMDPQVKKSKMDVLKALHGDMGKLMGDDMMGLKKVTVAAPDKAGLEEGLDKAGEMLGGKVGEMGAEEAPEMSEEPSTPEEVDAKIKELEELKAKMLMMKE